MRKQHFFLVLAFILLCSHDLYIRMDSYFLKPNQKATLNLYNGTFEKSENLITRDRMLDASLVFNGNRYPIDPSQWTDKDSTITQFIFDPIEVGTYVAGVSTKARNIKLTAEKFNDYLKHDGVLDMIEQRKNENSLDQDAVESYEKHVKAIFQVGDERTDDWKTVLGYPIEFIPQENPYEKYAGETLKVQLLLDGKPLANQLVYADHIHVSHDHDHDHDHGDHDHKHDSKEDSHDHSKEEHSHDHDDKEHKHDHKHDGDKHDHDEKPKEEHSHTNGDQLRTNAEGIVEVNLGHDGVYYLRTIHMVNVTDSDELTHRSKWATLTFEITHKHDHNDEEGIPIWIFVIGSLVFIGILFLVFRKKSE